MQKPLRFLFAWTAILCLAACGVPVYAGAPWKVGLACVKITPPRPVVLLGYGDRTGPFESVVADIYAKALALEDRRGQRAVIVTADLVGFQAAAVTDEVCRRIEEQTGLRRSRLLLNASHTHTGPLVSLDPHPAANSVAHAPLAADDARETAAYTRTLQDLLVQVVCDALARLEPARLSWGVGRVAFPTSRRLPQGGRIVMSDNPAGVTDRTVPVLRVDAPDGSLRSILFGCACHNTTLTGRDNVIAGDYAGFAQEYLERQHSGIQAMFMSGCGADANPSPRGSLEIARQHGTTLGSEVDRVLNAPLQPIQGDLRTAYRTVELPLQMLSRAEVEVRSQLPSAEAVMARHMLDVLDSGATLPRTYSAPLAVWQFGDALTMVALPAEPVADYVALIGRLLGPDKLWVSGFNNDCFGYLPTARVVHEGGHEAIGVTLWVWSQALSARAGFFASEVEQVVLDTVGQLAEEAGRLQHVELSDTPPSTTIQVANRGSAPQPVTPPYGIRLERNVRIPMRDGVTLSADVYRPDAEGPFPALVQVSYYVTPATMADFFVPRGYVCVLANSRGRGGSDGNWDPYVNEPRDGFDTQQWVGQQPWCNGQVGTFGQSYNGFTQTMSAPLASPYLKCMIPIEGQQSFFGHQYNDGVLQLNVIFTHGLFATGATGLQGHIPITDPHFLQLPLMSAADKVPHPQAQRIKTWLQHARYDDHWKSFSVKDKYDRIQAPAYFVTGWYDNLVQENFRNFQGFRQQGGSEAARGGTRLRVGPGVHGANPLPQVESLRWYDYWLKGLPTGINYEAPLRIYVMGAGHWRDEYEWPLARTQFTRFYLHSGGHANSVTGDGTLSVSAPRAESPPDSFVYNPANPVYTLGGQISTNPEIWGPQDRQSVQTRNDVLVYTTEPLTEEIEVTGPVELRLCAASSAVDTDFTATLTDVYPDGRAIHICEGIRGATFRESLEDPTPIVPGEVYEYSISLWHTSQRFAEGHRLRLEVSSSNFPRYARNQNTGLPLGTSAEMKTATQTIFHDGQYPSYLLLPLIPITPPSPIAPRADGSLHLTGHTAIIRCRSEDGTVPALKLAADAGILGWWTRAEDEATWNVDIQQPGRYRVVLTFACADDAAGNEFELSIGSAQLTGRVPGTGTWYDQRAQQFGHLDLAAGTQTVVLRSLHPIRHALFDLRSVYLRPE